MRAPLRMTSVHLRLPIHLGALGGVLVSLAACSPGSEARAGSDGSGGAANGAPPVPVAVAAAERRDIARTVTVTGPVEPVRVIGVNSQASGTVLTVRAQEGDRVAQGQLLARLDGREAQAQLERAEALLASAEAAYERARALHRSQIITDAELDQARSSFEVARSDVAVWRTRVGFTRIAAPAAGVVTAKAVEAGSAVSPNQQLFELADVSLLVVRVQLSELDVVHLAAGTAVEVRLDAYPAVALRGTVRRVFPAADPQSRLVPVEVALGPRPRGVDAKPGFLARVTFPLDEREGAVVVPAPAVGVSEGAAFVYLVEADTLVRRSVALGITAGGWVEVTEGLEPGDSVVTSGHTNLRSGARVRTREEGVP